MASAVAWALRTRWLVRTPIWLYRAGLGFLFGLRMLMLEHRGRTSGLRRYVVLEVVEHPAPREFVVVSGFGERAHWYRNIVAEHRVRLSTGLLRSAPAQAEPLTEAESAAALDRYAKAHPAAWRHLREGIEAAVGHPVQGLPMVRLTVDPR